MNDIHKYSTRFDVLSLLIISLFYITTCTEQQPADNETESVSYDELYRPQHHFTPINNWMNDPNGLVYHKGEYHLFYQHNPFGNTWGHMSWGHAVSDDLVHWEHLPLALKEENNIMIFSGSAVVDHNNTTDFGTEDNPPLVAIYTGHHTDSEPPIQDQRIAYSLDEGRTWTKYQGNPVIDGTEDFRDPKVVWHESSKKWVMVVALSAEQVVQFYGSKDLKEWELLSEFGPAGAADGILWECPDLFELQVDGDSTQSRWVLQVDVNPGAVAGGSGGQYFVGYFDGQSFTEDPSTQGQTLWVDYGRDFYAVQSFSDIPAEDGRRLWLAWMNNWDYANRIPTDPWRSAMSVPRQVGLTLTDNGYRVIQTPLAELQSLRASHTELQDIEILPGSSKPLDFIGKEYELVVELNAGDAQTFGLKVRKGGDEETVIGYDTGKKEFFADRTRSGNVAFDSLFASIQQAPMSLNNNKIRLHLFVDRSSIEVFTDEGKVAITDRIFPSDKSTGVELFSEGGTAILVSLDIWELDSIWQDTKN